MPAGRYDEEWDDGPYTEDGYVDDLESRALARYDESRYVATPEDDEDLLLDDDEEDALVIIPGAGVPARISHLRQRKRSLTLQVVLGSVILCVIIGALFTVMPLDAATGDAVTPLSALANAVNLSAANDFFLYRALPGDTFDSIAKKFGVQEGGIFKLNGLRADQSCLVGSVYKIPSDGNFGKDYTPPLPPGMSGAGYQCNFCAIAGMSNGPGGNCVTNYTSLNTTGDVTGYGLVIPDAKSRWSRGFSAFHSGVDISTGTLGTPIIAAQDGQVIFADWDQGGGGWTVKINHCGGLATSYSHLIDVKKVKVGQNVKAGDIIGYQGNSGESFGTHLHFMTWWYNIPFDPVCAYPGGIDGVSLKSEGAAYGGCPPGLSHSSVWWSN
jgi:murein DD-endopeptidase MepM/ murein hydrolase activator NlpD